MAKGDKVIPAVVVLKAGVASLADVELGVKKGEIGVDIVEPNRQGDPAVLTFSRKPAPKPS